jgi:hypothetical protein
MITGSVWINNKGGQYDSGGLSIYRKMQLLLKNDQDLGSWWSNESATIEGFIQSDYLTPNSRKDGLDKEQPAYDAIDKVMKKFIPAKLVNSKDGGINGGGFKRKDLFR